MTHTLKTWPQYFKAVQNGSKDFEIRPHDRPFSVGDTLVLQEYDPETKEYSGNEEIRKISYVLIPTETNSFGIMYGFCILSIKDIENY